MIDYKGGSIVSKHYLLGIAVLLSACTAGMQIDPPVEPTFDTRVHHNYAWLTSPMVDETGRAETIFHVDRLLRADVNQQLQHKGYRYVSRDSADFLVDYRYSETLQVEQGNIVAPTEALQMAWEPPDDIQETSMDDYLAPTYFQVMHIELLLLNPKGITLWGAKAHQTLDIQDPDDEALQAMLLPAVRKMLAHLPKARHP